MYIYYHNKYESMDVNIRSSVNDTVSYLIQSSCPSVFVLDSEPLINKIDLQWCFLFLFLLCPLSPFGLVKMLQSSTLRVVSDRKLDLVSISVFLIFFLLRQK